MDVGPKFLGISVLLGNKYNAQARLEPIMHRLADVVAETVHVGVLQDTFVVHVAGAVPASGLNMATRMGAKQLAHVTALGKALLATLSEDDIRDMYESEELTVSTTNAIQTRTALLTELKTTAQRGYAIDDEESRPGVRCIGAPIFNSMSTAIFSISVTTAPARLQGKRLTEVSHAVRLAAAEASTSFGGTIPAWWGENAPPLDPAVFSTLGSAAASALRIAERQ